MLICQLFLGRFETRLIKILANIAIGVKIIATIMLVSNAPLCPKGRESSLGNTKATPDRTLHRVNPQNTGHVG